MRRAVLAGALITAALAAVGCGGDRAAAPAATPAGPRLSSGLARTLQAGFAAEVADAGIPGASAAIVFPDGRVWSGAAGAAVLTPRTAMTPRTSFSFDSVTKIATAALALRLTEQRRLRLDDPIRRWYPAWRGDPKATIRDLLGHTSGLGDPPGPFFERLVRFPRRHVTPSDAVRATPRPGGRTTEAEYSNTGFILAGIILARAAGEPVATAMRRDLFGAPGGDGLALQPADRPQPPRVHPYFYPHGGSDPVDASHGGPFIPSRAWAGAASTAGALAGDVPSLARWAHALLGGHVLRAASLREMTRFRPGAFWNGYGLGLARSAVDGHVMWGHGGDGLGTHTELWHLPREDVTVAVSWNDDDLEDDAPFVPTLLRAVLGRAGAPAR